MNLSVKSGAAWADVWDRARSAAPEAFDTDRIRNLIDSDWVASGVPGEHVTPVDGSAIPGPPRIDHDTAIEAVRHAAVQHKAWSVTDLDERKARVSAAVAELRRAPRHRSRCSSPGRSASRGGWPAPTSTAGWTASDWYVGQIERQLDGRTPLPGPVSNIASWNYPTGARSTPSSSRCSPATPSWRRRRARAAFTCLTLAHALMRREGAARDASVSVGGRQAASATSSSAARVSALSPRRRRRGDRPQGRFVSFSPTPAARGTCSSRRGSTPGAYGTARSGTRRRRTSRRASSTPSSAAPLTRATWCAGAIGSPEFLAMYLGGDGGAALRAPRSPWPGDDD